MITIKTASWFTKLTTDHARIGISRGTPRGQPAGFRIYRKLAPGLWFNNVGVEEYIARYSVEILAPLDPRKVAAELVELAGGRIPVMLCFEKAGGPSWCHRSLAAAWLADQLAISVPEFGFEDLPQDQHPLRPPTVLV
jgi:hypothetical protein